LIEVAAEPYRGTVPTIPNPPNPQQPHPKPGGWPADGGTGTGTTRKPSLEQVREQLRLFLILLLGLIIVSQLSLPFRLGGLVLALGIGWVGIQLLIAMMALNRAGTPARGWPSVIIGLGLAGVLTLVLGVQALLYPITVDHERCLSEANTLRAKSTCDRMYQDRLDKITNDLRNRPTP
jgi:hypothetical protein